jgi:hypothetical protein
MLNIDNSKSGNIPDNPKYEELSKIQVRKIQDRIEKGRYLLFVGSILIIVISCIFFLVPISLLPSGETFLLQDIDPAQTISESIGSVPTMVFLMLSGGLFPIAILRHMRIFKLKKDLVEKKSIIFDAKVNHIRERKGYEEKKCNVYLDKNCVKLKKLSYPVGEFTNVKEGDLVTITLTSNAQFILSARKARKKRYEQMSSEENDQQQVSPDTLLSRQIVQ